MKIIFFLLILNSFILSQEYQKGKIEMHGSKFDNYNSIGGYKDGGFRRVGMSATDYLDKKSTKKSATSKANSYELSQVGDVSLFLNGQNYKKVNYKAIVASAKNLKTIFIGSTLSVEGTTITITEIHANKRIKRQARTGTIRVEVNSEKVILNYIYDKGHFSAKGLQKNSKEISFSLEIKALLCHSQG